LTTETSERDRLRDTAAVVGQVMGLCGRLGLRQSRIFLSRFACKPVSYYKWFRFLIEYRRRHGLGRPHDDLLRKKPYKFLALGLSGHRGVDLLAGHFELAAAGMPRDRLEAAWRGRPMDLGLVSGRRDAYALTMRLSVHSGTSHEGAFSIKLTRQSDRLDLVKLSFILYPLDQDDMSLNRHPDPTPSWSMNFSGKPVPAFRDHAPGCNRYTVAVGGLQGSREARAKRAVVDATRDMCGLRPKDAALLVMEGIAIGGGAHHLLGVSDARHTINFRASAKRARKRADMDQYWIDRGGLEGGEFGFAIPLRNREIAEPFSRRDFYKAEFLEIGKGLFARSADPATPGAA
jgi:uncharacterized protein VirK/YbjX